MTSWEAAFARMDTDEQAWLSGYPERAAQDVTRLTGALGTDLAWHHRLVGLGAYLVRSHTLLTAEWLREVERRLDYYADQAAEFPGEERGEVVGYPISWTRLLASRAPRPPLGGVAAPHRVGAPPRNGAASEWGAPDPVRQPATPSCRASQAYSQAVSFHCE